VCDALVVCLCLRQALAARGLQADMWKELASKVPSQARLDTIGTSLRRAMADANSTFAHLIRLNPNSVATLRKYARFLAEVPIFSPAPPPPGTLLSPGCCGEDSELEPVEKGNITMLEVLLRAYRCLQVLKDTLGAERVTQDADAVEETTAIAIANRSSQVRWACPCCARLVHCALWTVSPRAQCGHKIERAAVVVVWGLP
jgi:hypothetical protein